MNTDDLNEQTIDELQDLLKELSTPEKWAIVQAPIGAAPMTAFTQRRDTELMSYYKASVRASQELGLDQGSHLAHRAASREQWAADEMIRFAQMLTPRAAFPSFRFARLMATASRAA